jgi:hypothetical protein
MVHHVYLEDLFQLPIAEHAYQEFLQMKTLCDQLGTNMQEKIMMFGLISSNHIIILLKSLMEHRWAIDLHNPILHVYGKALVSQNTRSSSSSYCMTYKIIFF